MFSIIILNYKNSQLTLRCIDSILKYSEKWRYEIILIDNSGEDHLRLQSYVEELKEDKVDIKLISPWYNTFFIGWVNLWVSLAKYDIIALVNNDWYFRDSSLDDLYDFFVSHKSSYSAVTGCIIDGSSKDVSLTGTGALSIWTEIFRISFLGRICRWFNVYPPFYRKYLLLDRDRANQSKDIDVACNAYIMFSKKDFENIWWYDPNLLLYYSEEDFYYKMKNSWKKVRYLHNVRMFHDRWDSTKLHQNSKIIAIMLRDRYLFWEKWYGSVVAHLITFCAIVWNPYTMLNWYAIYKEYQLIKKDI